MKRASWVCAAMVALAISGGAFGDGAHSSDERAIRARLAAFAAAWNRHDPKALARMFDDDATLTSASGRLAKGLGEIERLFEEEQRTTMRSTTFAWIAQSIRLMESGRALVHGECEIAGFGGPEGKSTSTARFRVSAVFAKEDGDWEVLPFMFARMPASKARAPTRTD